jgi:acyl-CoA reductase-like NAD-dependent aldehyde dehydrogenase
MIARLRAEAAREPDPRRARLLRDAADLLADVRDGLAELESAELIPAKLRHIHAVSVRIDVDTPAKLCGTASP